MDYAHAAANWKIAQWLRERHGEHSGKQLPLMRTQANAQKKHPPVWGAARPTWSASCHWIPAHRFTDPGSQQSSFPPSHLPAHQPTTQVFSPRPITQ